MSVHFTVEYVHFLHHRFNKYVYLIFFLEKLFSEFGHSPFSKYFSISERKYVRPWLIADWSISMACILDFLFGKTFLRIWSFPFFKILFPKKERKYVRPWLIADWSISESSIPTLFLGKTFFRINLESSCKNQTQFNGRYT